MTMRFPQLAPTIFITALAAGCGNTKRIDEAPIAVLRNGDRLEGAPSRAMDATSIQSREASAAGRERRDSLSALALSTCAPEVCAALGHGELALGMTEAQVMAATQSTDASWVIRRSGMVEVLTPRDRDAGPRDAVAPVAFVQLANGSVVSVTYHEPQGFRTMSALADANDANRTRAASLVREGDALAAAGDFSAALDRYDRASILTPADAELQYRMAASLDKLLRPIEAQVRYTLFLHQLELQKIDAMGNANAKMAAAIAEARQRIIILDKQR